MQLQPVPSARIGQAGTTQRAPSMLSFLFLLMLASCSAFNAHFAATRIAATRIDATRMMLPFHPVIGSALETHETFDAAAIHTDTLIEQVYSSAPMDESKGRCMPGGCDSCTCKKGRTGGISMSAGSDLTWEEEMVLESANYLESVMASEERALKELETLNKWVQQLPRSERDGAMADLLDSLG